MNPERNDCRFGDPAYSPAESKIPHLPPTRSGRIIPPRLCLCFLAWIFELFLVSPLGAKDFPQVFPSIPEDYPRAGGSFSYENSLLVHTEWDSFLLRTGTWGALAGTQDAAMQFYFDSVLMGGPLAAGEAPAAVIAFWLNAVQFEYGVLGSFRITPWGLLGQAEYGRRSLHPFRPLYSQVSYDILALGFRWKEQYSSWGLSLEPRLAYVELLPFWQSWLPSFRERYRMELSGEIHRSLAPALMVYSRGKGSLLLLRTGDWGGEFFGEAGLRWTGTRGQEELYVKLYLSDDSELLDQRTHKDAQAGLGFRLSTE